MFNSFASSIIGFLIAALSTVGGHATITVTGDTASSTQATSTQVEVDDSFIVGLANALVRLQTRFDHGRSGKDGNNANGISDEDADEDSDESEDSDDSERKSDDSRKDNSVQSDRRREPELRGREEENEEEFEDEGEFEDEEGDEDEDEDGDRGGSSTSGSTGTSGNAGTSGSGSTSGSASSSTGAKTTFTMAEVATHNTAASCYSAINGGVYNLTSWISQHPGGQNAIKGLCGVDGSAAFNNQHGGSGKPESVLAGYKIGTLAQ